MAFNINTNISGNNSYGTISKEDIREISVFYFDGNGSLTLRVKMNDGSELCVSSDGEKRVIEWDSEKRVATVADVDSNKMASLMATV